MIICWCPFDDTFDIQNLIQKLSEKTSIAHHGANAYGTDHNLVLMKCWKKIVRTPMNPKSNSSTLSEAESKNELQKKVG